MSKKALFYTTLLLLGVLFFPLNSLTKEKTSDNKTIVLSKNNTVVLNQEVGGEALSQVILQARKLGSKSSLFGKEHIYLFLNTPGGSIQSGLEMVEALKGLHRQVDTISLFSASMGFQLVQSLGERLVLKNGVLMSHRARGEFAGYFGGQRPSQMDSRYGLWLSRIDEMDQQTVNRTKGKQTLESYRRAYADELWLTGTQAVEQGYADRVVSISCDSSLDGATTHSVDFFGIKILYDLDNCPINTEPMNIRMVFPEKEKVDTVANAKKAEEVKKQFLEQYVQKQRLVVPMYW